MLSSHRCGTKGLDFGAFLVLFTKTQSNSFSKKDDTPLFMINILSRIIQSTIELNKIKCKHEFAYLQTVETKLPKGNNIVNILFFPWKNPFNGQDGDVTPLVNSTKACLKNEIRNFMTDKHITYSDSRFSMKHKVGVNKISKREIDMERCRWHVAIVEPWILWFVKAGRVIMKGRQGMWGSGGGCGLIVKWWVMMKDKRWAPWVIQWALS